MRRAEGGVRGRGRVSARRPGRSRRAGRLGCGLAALLFGCSGEAEPPTAGQVLREGVDMVAYEMRTYVTREGVRRARLEADTAEFMTETEIHMRPVSLTFFDQEGREATVITADFGIYYELNEDMEAQGSVVVLDREDDQRLETERLRYVRAEDKLYGDLPFVLTSDGGRTRLEGSAFESDPSLDDFRVPSPSGSSERVVVPGPAGTDTAGGAHDSLGAPADSAVGAGGAASDTAGAASDTAGAASDTAGAASDPTAAARDTSAGDTLRLGTGVAPPGRRPRVPRR